MSTEKLRLDDLKISLIIIKRNALLYEAQQYDELLGKIGESLGFSDSQKKEETAQPGNLPGEDFSNLSWSSYKTKERAKPNEAGWCFANAAGADVLVSTLKSKPDGKATIGEFEYSLQGPEKKFVSRKPKQAK